jgi:hypothetical protein
VRARLRVVGVLLAVAAVLVVCVATIGVLIALWRDSDVGETAGYALVIAGAVCLLLVGGGMGGRARDAAAGRVVLGGRLYGAAFQETPLGYGIVGLVLVAAGVLVLVAG